ncbi:serine/threonine protein kinase ATG1 [Aspergillus mulundensis]|uniref:Serine/threonine-protein kinase ATG1 n=1 Tax=Aspergillus mulundensis TaxID=1810919 RepID=A0A3D8S531_9EURO|nr:Serine kinase atg1 [Aspergillus mulundensis]RDW81300.1 Serine kinase atg1 [Aspergillus mulundensis]
MASTPSKSSRSSKEAYSEVTIGRYTRMDHIGKGSFATVYRGVHTVSSNEVGSLSLHVQLRSDDTSTRTDVCLAFQKSRTFVAIKSVNLGKLNKKLKDNLALEIDILKNLLHPHIVALLDCLETPSHIHLVMEYCALGDLSQFIKRRESLKDHSYTRHMISKYPNVPGGALNEVVVRHFLKQLASSLKFLRDRNLIHRDIKPQNLLLCPAPAYAEAENQTPPLKGCDNSFTPAVGLETLPLLKLADFGFARSLPATSLAETLCGSPLYMAPEILRYEKYDAKADLWSVGTVLYEMVVGKPPFRATNHVELLRKIENAKDKIKFPEENPVSGEIKSLVRGLLKFNPVIRMTFTDFFGNDVITGPIPGLAAEDLPAPVPEPSPELAPASSSQDSRAINHHGLAELESSPETTQPQNINAGNDKEDRYPPPHRYVPHNERPQTHTTTTPMRRSRSGDRPSSAKPIPVAAAPLRPEAVSHATAPGRQELIGRPSTGQQAPSTPPVAKTVEKIKEERELAAQDVAFERDYVVVEKRAVEVNAFADQMAYDPRIQGKHTGALSRRQTTPALPTTTQASPQNSPSKAVQVVAGRSRADSAHNRHASYERRYGQSPNSAQSAISKALNMASGRLFGMGFSPPLNITKGGRSPPLAYNPFPAYPAAQHAGLLTMGDGARPQVGPDEDTGTVKELEECATRSDVVYGFAEVKYKQLIPLAPSAQSYAGSNAPGTDFGDSELTADAAVTLSEEALVLYVKALSLLAKSMDIAGAWWMRKNRAEALGETVFSRLDPVSIRINKVVQWVRSRFNEVLEKAEFVRLKLLEAQRRLPIDHPSHPNNLSLESAGSGTSVDVVVSPGVTAEKLMYDRALELSRSAAINELTGEDLPGCEIAYVTAIRMLEAVLETDEVQSSSQGRVALDGVQEEEREVLLKLVSKIRMRLATLRQKLAVLAKRQTPPSSGKMIPSNLAHATPATGVATSR